ncbi:protein FtsI/penicillin-binding protein 2, partial [gut metagenome]
NLVINKLMLTGDLNEMLVELITVLEESGDEWNDQMPIAMYTGSGYMFINEEIPQVQKRLEELKKFINVQQYATADQVMEALVEQYELESYSAEWQRKLAGVRYQMSVEGFSDVNNFILAKDVSLRTVAVVRERGLSNRGADITETSYRIYEDGTLAPHLLGTVGSIFAEDWRVENENGDV